MVEKELIKKLLEKTELKMIFDIFNTNNIDLRLVGGCIRDALLTNNVKDDIDIAINCLPDETIAVLKQNDIQFNEYSKKYGSIIAIINKKKFELTSLREDVNQLGRDTEVIFTNDWNKDANRRDFTFNAIYLSFSGKIYDPLEGYNDLLNQKIKFIGNIERRISEDYIRIFRYYRFLGCFKDLKVNKDYEEILEKYIPNIFEYISKESMRNEIIKMLKNAFPKNSFINYKNPSLRNSLISNVNNFWKKENYLLGLSRCMNMVDKYFI